MMNESPDFDNDDDGGVIALVFTLAVLGGIALLIWTGVFL